jgi:hypothetical protein
MNGLRISKQKSRAFIGCNKIIDGGRQGYTIRQNKMISTNFDN